MAITVLEQQVRRRRHRRRSRSRHRRGCHHRQQPWQCPAAITASEAQPIGVHSNSTSHCLAQHAQVVRKRPRKSSKMFSNVRCSGLLGLSILLLVLLPAPPARSSSLVSDLIVNIGDNVLLDCEPSSGNDQPQANPLEGSHHRTPPPHAKHLHPQTSGYVWCRHQVNDADGGTRNITCFLGDAYFIANEDQISTVTYRCYRRQDDPVLPIEKIEEPKSAKNLLRIFRLYVDQFSSRHQKREAPIVQRKEYDYRSLRSRLAPKCRAPRCKPYASVVSAQCSRIELSIRYPSSQYGYNASADHWGTVLCNDHVTGYQLWLIGYGVVKRFMPDERIVLTNLVPGKRYCFNGWAYNGCGPGPVFTLEGVCAKNTDDCLGGFDEHCELDVDYSD